MPSHTRTKASTPRLSELAKHVVAPKNATATGWPAVHDKCRELGVTFRPWQPNVGRLILAKRPNGKYAATIGGTGLSIARQVGKTFLVGAIVFALCLLRPNLTVIWTAHRLRTAEETFEKLKAFARRRKIAPHVLKIVSGSGEGGIHFRNGSRILFGARERGFGRGFDEVDVLIFDEAQILTENAMDDMIPAANQSRQDTGALLLFMGTPPKPKDPSEVFTRMRSDALSGDDDDTGWVEFGADSDFIPTEAPAQLTAADWRQVAKANPSYPHDTPRESILRMRKKLGPESFRREGLGIWDADAGIDVFGVGRWLACRDDRLDADGLSTSKITGKCRIAIAVSPDQSRASVVVAGATADGLTQVELVPDDRRRPSERLKGTSWVAKRCRQVAETTGTRTVTLDPRTGAGALVQALKRESLNVDEVSTTDYARACGMFFDAVEDAKVRHLGQPLLDAAVRLARQRPMGDAWKWEARQVAGDVTPLVGATLAFAAAQKPSDVSIYFFSDLDDEEGA